jgi:hypothetical protein
VATLTLSDAQAKQVLGLTDNYKASTNRTAAKLGLLATLLYRRIDPLNPEQVNAWAADMATRLITASDQGARLASVYFDTIRLLETPQAEPFKATPSLGVIDAGVQKSLLVVGPYDYANKVANLEKATNISDAERKGALADAQKVAEQNILAATVRHAQAGSRDTIHNNAGADPVALGYVRVTKAKPCFFCAMLASRGLTYRSFKEGSFEASDANFTGDGNAKVHDGCGCSLIAVYAKNDPLLAKTEQFQSMWSMWGAGGGDASLRFRRGYDHFQKTGSYLTWDEANKGLRAA